MLQSVGSQRVRHDGGDLACTHTVIGEESRFLSRHFKDKPSLPVVGVEQIQVKLSSEGMWSMADAEGSGIRDPGKTPRVLHRGLAY